MSVVLTDGFDAYDEDLANFPSSTRKRWNGIGGGTGDGPLKINTSSQRYDTGKGLYRNAPPTFSTAFDTQGARLLYGIGDVVDASQEVVFGMSYRNRIYGNITPVFSLADALGRARIGMGVTAAGYLMLARHEGLNHFNLGLSEDPIPENAWVFIEGKIAISPAGATQVTIRVNGEQQLQNLATGHQDNVRDFVLGVTPSSEEAQALNGLIYEGGRYDADDLYILRNDGVGLSDFLGERRITTRYPDAEVAGQIVGYSRTGGTGVADSVGEGSLDDDTSYYEGTATGDRAIFSSTDTLPANVKDISNVAVNHVSRKTEAEQKDVGAMVRTGGANFQSSGVNSVPNTYGVFDQNFETNPDTGLAWTKAEVDSSDFGPEVR